MDYDRTAKMGTQTHSAKGSVPVRRVGTVVVVVALALGLMASAALAHVHIAGNVPNSGGWVHYNTWRQTEVADQQIQVNDLPGRPMDIYLRLQNGNRLGDIERWTTEGVWRTMATNVISGTTFAISARKDPDYYSGTTYWDGILHY